MAIKSTESSNVPEFSYPKLMQGKSGVIVLMTSPCTGTVVKNHGGWTTGRHHDAWDMAGFEDYHGTVTLENE